MQSSYTQEAVWLVVDIQTTLAQIQHISYLLCFIASDKGFSMGCLTFYFNQILPTVNCVSLWSRSLAGSHKASFCVCFRNAARNVQTCLPVTLLTDKPCECSLYLLVDFFQPLALSGCDLVLFCCVDEKLRFLFGSVPFFFFYSNLFICR